MRRLIALVAVAGLLLTPASAALAGDTVTWTEKGGVWTWDFHHWNPCTEGWSDAEFTAKFRATSVDHDGDLDTIDDRLRVIKSLKVLSSTFIDEPEWELSRAGVRLVQIRWDEELFGDDEERAVVNWYVRLKASNPSSGESYNIKSHLNWVVNGQGEVVRPPYVSKETISACK